MIWSGPCQVEESVYNRLKLTLRTPFGADNGRDAAICDLGGAMSAEIRNATKPVKQLRIATADRAG